MFKEKEPKVWGISPRIPLYTLYIKLYLCSSEYDVDNRWTSIQNIFMEKIGYGFIFFLTLIISHNLSTFGGASGFLPCLSLFSLTLTLMSRTSNNISRPREWLCVSVWLKTAYHSHLFCFQRDLTNYAVELRPTFPKPWLYVLASLTSQLFLSLRRCHRNTIIILLSVSAESTTQETD